MQFRYLLLFFICNYCVGNTSETSTALRGNGMNFIENKGQVVDMNQNLRPDVLFVGDGGGNKVYLRQTGISYVLLENLVRTFASEEEKLGAGPDTRPINGCRVDVNFVGANNAFQTRKEQEVEGYTNYYYAHCPTGITHVKGFNKVTYENIYNNIDFVAYGNKANGIKYDMVVNPGGEVNDIQLNYTGVDNIKEVNGRLYIETSVGTIEEWMPKVYQTIDGTIQDVAMQYIVKKDESKEQSFFLSFSVGAYNKNYSLVIDPSSAWITFMGGSGMDYANTITADNLNNLITSGTTFSNGFPVSVGAFQVVNNSSSGTKEIVVASFSNTGSRNWATYFGGSKFEVSKAIAHDSQNNLSILGITNSLNLPVTLGAFQSSNPMGVFCYFLFQLNSAGILNWSSYYRAFISGQGAMAYIDGYSSDLAIDQNDNIVFCGTAMDSLPISSTQSINPGNTKGNAFVSKFDKLGNIVFANFYSAVVGSESKAVAADALNNIVLVGQPLGLYPTTINPFGCSTNVFESFCVKMDAIGNIVWSTMIPGNFPDVQCNASNDIVVSTTADGAYTCSPPTNNPFQGGTDLYLVKLNANGSILWSTAFGTSDRELFPFLTLDANGNPYIFGEYEDFEASITTSSCGYQNTFGGIEDHYIAKFDGLTGDYLCSTYLGGPDEDDWDNGDVRGDIKVKNGFIYFVNAGQGGYPTTANSFQPTHAGGFEDLVIGRICALNCGDDTYSDVTFDTTVVPQGCSVQVNYTPHHYCDPSGTNFVWSFQGGTPSSSTSFNPQVSYSSSGTYQVKLIISSVCNTDSVFKSVTVSIPNNNVTISGDSVLCTGSLSILEVKGVSTANWSPASNLNTATSTTVIANPPTSVTYTVSGNTTQGCPYTLPYTLTVNALPSIATTTIVPVSCNSLSDGSAAVAGQNTFAPYSYNWSNGETTNTLSNVSANTYSVTVADGNGCTNTATISITEPPALIITTTGDSAACAGRTSNLTAVPTGGNGGFAYQWTPFSSITNTVSTLVNTTTAYQVTVTDSRNCTASYSSTLTWHALPQVSYTAQDTAGCAPLCVKLANTTDNTQQVQWYFSDGSQSTMSNATQCFANSGSYSYSVTVIDNNGCSNNISSTNSITVYGLPQAAFTPSSYSTDVLNANVNYSNESTNAVSYLWNFGDNSQSTSTIVNPSYSYPDTGYFCTKLIAISQKGCIDSTSQCITVNPNFAFYIPNSFTPNSDGINDLFNGWGIGIAEYQLWIYNRWGQMLYTTHKTYSPETAVPWNGRVNNILEIVQQDVYVWKVQLTDIFGKHHNYVGHVSVIR
ncbi:MAG: gliding motility-associated C-terminal domain-containing protein [Bacteroidetes bacterium]|nr:gliding motility-associated C-terminal domain-containing protein [Bacteroidota bacterium]